MATIYFIPTPGLIVRDPATGQVVPPQGAEKPRNLFWLRRIKDGDGSEGQPPVEQPAETNTPAAVDLPADPAPRSNKTKKGAR